MNALSWFLKKFHAFYVYFISSGLILIVYMLLNWVAVDYIQQYLQNPVEDGVKPMQPYFLWWCTQASHGLMYPLYRYLAYKHKKRQSNKDVSFLYQTKPEEIYLKDGLQDEMYIQHNSHSREEIKADSRHIYPQEDMYPSYSIPEEYKHASKKAQVNDNISNEQKSREEGLPSDRLLNYTSKKQEEGEGDESHLLLSIEDEKPSKGDDKHFQNEIVFDKEKNSIHKLKKFPKVDFTMKSSKESGHGRNEGFLRRIYRGFLAFCSHERVRAFILALLLCVTQLSYMVAITETPISVMNAIYNSYILFAVLFSYLVLRERITLVKGLFVLVGFCGVVIITIIPLLKVYSADEGARLTLNTTYLLLIVLSVVLYAFFTVFLKWLFIDTPPDMITLNTIKVLSQIGIITLCVGLPILLTTHFTGISPIVPPHNTLIYWAGFILLILFCVTFDWALTVTLNIASPIWVAAGNMLVFPISLLIDSIFLNVKIHLFEVIGMILVFASFISISILYAKQEIQEKKQFKSNKHKPQHIIQPA